MRNREPSTTTWRFFVYSLPVNSDGIAALKAELHELLPAVPSAHLAEGVAALLGFSSNAALRCAASANPDHFALLHPDAFLQRLKQFGYAAPAYVVARASIATTEIVRTAPDSAAKHGYRSQRDRAWRNLMVAGVNAGLDQGLFTLRPGDNRWPSRSDRQGTFFDFQIGGLPARAYVGDANFDELVLCAAVLPVDDRMGSWTQGFSAGEAVGKTWLERRDAAYIQSTYMFSCRQRLLLKLASLDVDPKGYGDRGNVIM